MIRLVCGVAALLMAGTAMAADVPSVPPATPVAAFDPTAAAALKYKSEIVCRSEVETGSLVKRHKSCLTRKQWGYVDDQHQSAARSVVEAGTGRPSCGGPGC